MGNELAWAGSAAAWISIGIAALGVILILSGFTALLWRQPLSFALRSAFGLALVAFGTFLGAISIGTYGYRSLTDEQRVAEITVRPTGEQRFDATFRFPDGRVQAYALAGDELYVDAHILKWKALATLFGFRTLYELDRVGGRYRGIEDERNKPRSVFPLGSAKPVDLFSLRHRFTPLALIVDAEYGSAAFAGASQPTQLDLTVSPSGLVIRAKPEPAKPPPPPPQEAKVEEPKVEEAKPAKPAAKARR